MAVVTNQQQEAYFAARSSGQSKYAAAKIAGISYKTAMRMEGGEGKYGDAKRAFEDKQTPDVIPRDKLKPDALRALDDFGYFRRRYMGRIATPWQEEAAYRMVEFLDSPDKEYVVVNAPPGSGKSTAFTHDIPAWIACRDRSIRCMIGSRTEKQARMYTARLRRTFERRRPVKSDTELVRRGLAFDAQATLLADYGRFTPLSKDLWRMEEFVIAQEGDNAVEDKESSFVAYGMDSGFLGGRFDLVIWDDLVDKRNLRTAEARENLIAWWETEAETRLEPGGLLVLQGQRMGAEDLYRYALDLVEGEPDEDGELTDEKRRKYHHIVFKAHYEDRCKGPGSHGADALPYPDGCLIDPQRLPFRELQRIKANRLERFLVLYQQEDTDPSTALVQPIWINGGKGADGVDYPGCWDEDRRIGVIPDGLSGDRYSVVTVDPSPTRYWAIQWWLYHPDTEFQHLIDLFRDPMEAPQLLDWNRETRSYTGLLEEWWQRSKDRGRPISHLIVEANAAQRFILQYKWAKDWAAERSILIVPHETHRNKSDPEYGVQTIAPHYKFGRVRLPGNRTDGSRAKALKLVSELTKWPDGSTDDCVMAHWFLLHTAQRLLVAHITEPPRFQRIPAGASLSRYLVGRRQSRDLQR